MIRVGLCQVDGKIPNLALLKLSAWHKAQGDRVAWFCPLEPFDQIYASKVFSWSADNAFLPRGRSDIRVQYGGTGYGDYRTTLPDEVEAMCPDYDLAPEMDYALGFTTRGCPRGCAFCIVPKKEGSLKVICDLDAFWRGQEKLLLLDNNLTAAPWDHFERVLNQIVERKIIVDFTQGLDIRLITPDHANLLAKIKVPKTYQIPFAWDNVRDERAVRRGIEIIRSAMPLKRIMFFVLIGFDSSPAEDLLRVMALRGLGVDPFVMPYDRRDTYQRAFARWVNHKAIFNTVSWDEYRDGQWSSRERERRS